MTDKWNMTDEQLIEILRGLGNATRKMNRNYDRTIYDVAADHIERLLRSSREEAEPRETQEMSWRTKVGPVAGGPER